jgi:Lrp/AsnC family transcriptional regulator, leucine-responsive regulatory protein
VYQSHLRYFGQERTVLAFIVATPNFHGYLTSNTEYNSAYMPSDRILDEVDARILEILQENARTTQADVAKAVGLAPSAVLERIRKLESRGAIREYSARIDPHLAQRALLAFVAVRTSEYGPEQSSAKALAQLPDVLEIHHVAGEDCFFLKVRARDAEHLGQMLRTQIAAVPGVTSTRTTIVLETVKETSRIPLQRGLAPGGVEGS